jgi:hypothetical protein
MIIGIKTIRLHVLGTFKSYFLPAFSVVRCSRQDIGNQRGLLAAFITRVDSTRRFFRGRIEGSSQDKKTSLFPLLMASSIRYRGS